MTVARRLLPCARRYLGMGFLRVMEYRIGDAARAAGERRDVVCRELSEPEVLAFAEDATLRLAAPWVKAALGRGAICVGALRGAHLIGYTWFSFGDTPYSPGVWVSFPPAVRYSCKGFVRPEHRGQRILQALHAFADRPELWRGRRASVSLVDADNFSSLTALARAGARMLGHATYARIFGAVVAWHSPGLLRAGVCVSAPPNGMA